jgi:hypothetical protein
MNCSQMKHALSTIVGQRSTRRGEIVKTKTLFILMACALFPGTALAQLDCAQSSNLNKLVCAFPISAATLSQYTFGKNSVDAALKAAPPINSAAAVQLTQLPIPNATVGIVSLRKKGSDIPVPYDNLGPILFDRPDTVGRGNIFVGWSYQHFNFNAFDGYNLGALPTAFSYSEPKLDPGNNQIGTLTHYGSMVSDIEFKINQFVSLATFGVTKTTDLTLVIPASTVDLRVISSKFTATTFDSSTQSYFSSTTTGGFNVVSKGSSSGIGDVTLTLKQLLLGQDQNRPAAALGATFRLPTGDSFNYLGSGAYGGSVFGLVEYRNRITPHAKFAYQWNYHAKLTGKNLPGGLSYAVGMDARVNHRVTVVADLLGTQFVNAPFFTVTTNNFNPVPPSNSGVPPQFTSVSTPDRTYTTANFSGGAKFLLPHHILLYGNFLVQVNNTGLRSEVVPLAGIAYTFRREK